MYKVSLKIKIHDPIQEDGGIHMISGEVTSDQPPDLSMKVSLPHAKTL